MAFAARKTSTLSRWKSVLLTNAGSFEMYGITPGDAFPGTTTVAGVADVESLDCGAYDDDDCERDACDLSSEETFAGLQLGT